MRQPKITIPTYFTILRFFLVPVFIYLFLEGRYFQSVAVLITAGLTDLLDGFIARRFHMRSRLGSMLDPLADKFLMLASYLFLSAKGHLSWNLTWLIIGRDAGILLGIGFLNLRRIKLYYRPTFFSKLTTASQLVVLTLAFTEVLLLSRPVGFLKPLALHQFKEICISLAAALTLFSAVQYAYIGYKFYRYGERKA